VKVKMIIISSLYSIIISIFFSFVYIAYDYSKVNRFDLKENVQRVQVTSIIPSVLNDKEKILEFFLDVFKGSETSIVHIPYDSNGIEILIIGKENEELFNNIAIDYTEKFFLVNNDSFYARNIEIYGLNRTDITAYFNIDELPGYDYIADFKNYGTSVEGEYIVESNCKECVDLFPSIFSSSAYQVSNIPVIRNFIETLISNPAVNLMLYSTFIISVILFLFVNHIIKLERRKIGIQKLYGGTKSEIIKAYLVDFFLIELGSNFFINVLLYFILRQILSYENTLIVLAISIVVGSSLMIIISLASIVSAINSKVEILWK
jgi:hypothetical protein